MKLQSSRIALTLSISLIALINYSANATVWRINNQSQSSEVFTSIQDAIDDDRVFAGDTLLLEASPEFYNGADVDKRIVTSRLRFFSR